MTRRKPKKPRRPPRQDQDQDPPSESTRDLLADVRDVLLALLATQVCKACAGTGKCPAGTFDPATGRPLFSDCACRNRARDLVAEFEGEGDGGEDSSEEGFEEAEDPGARGWSP